MPKPKIKLTSLKLNDGSHGLPKNPRFIRDEKFAKLCQSIKDFPEAMPARGIVVDEKGVILGGNMRWRACKELGFKEIPAEWVHRMKGLTTEQKRRFIIMDNRAFGEDDMDMLANEWNVEELLAAGMTLGDLGLSSESGLAEEIAAAKEWVDEYDEAADRVEKLKAKLDELHDHHPEKIAGKGAIILAPEGGEFLFVSDDVFTDFLTEVRRYAGQGSDSPLEKILDACHKL